MCFFVGGQSHAGVPVFCRVSVPGNFALFAVDLIPPITIEARCDHPECSARFDMTTEGWQDSQWVHVSGTGYRNDSTDRHPSGWTAIGFRHAPNGAWQTFCPKHPRF